MGGKMSTPPSALDSLTSFEVVGLNSKFNFSDGHAYHAPPRALAGVYANLGGIWEAAATSSIPDAEHGFKNALANLIDSPRLERHNFFSVLPTASNSIDIVAAWLHMRGKRTGLLEPAFDNLPLMLKRRDLVLYPVNERDLLDLDSLEKKIDSQKLTALFVILPNNPTGFMLNALDFRSLCELCERKGVTFIVDKTFRLYSRDIFDDYAIMQDSGVEFVVIEDTGKTWPTLDLKVSLLVYKDTVASELRMLYEEIFLCSSNFVLLLLTRLAQQTAHHGLAQVVQKPAAARLGLVGDVLANSPLSLVPNKFKTVLPLAWIDCKESGTTDLELVAYLKGYGLAVLPGRNFYWNSPEENTYNIRISLMRPTMMFYTGLKALEKAVSHLSFPFYHLQKIA
jgi:aspartate/methionine/tyrosine aminotransferase